MFKNKYGIRDSITDNTCNNKCSRCGDCCGLFIPFTDRDVERIRKYVRKNKIEPQNRNVGNSFKSQCCFYDDTNHICSIYSVRPYVCRDFICNRKNWMEKRDKYESKAKYNSTVNGKLILATFDDKIYKNYYPLLLHVLECCRGNNGMVDSKKLVAITKAVHREDLLEQFSAQDENGNEYKGTELINEGQEV